MAATLARARRGSTATVLADGRVLVTVDDWQDPSPAADRYDPATGRWTALPAMVEVRCGQTATLLGDGSVLVAGGGSGSFAWLFDPRSEP